MGIYQQGQALPGTPGVDVVIVPPQTNYLSPAATDILGVVGTATWGPVNAPLAVAGAADYPAKYGTPVARKYDMGTAVYLASLQGSQNMRCVRVTDSTDAAATALVGLKTATSAIAAGGSGYAINDQCTLSNGAVIKVLSLSISAIATFSVLTQPTSVVTGTGAVTQVTTTGSGTGATFTFTYAQGATATSLYTGSGANLDTITVGPGNAPSSYKVTIARPGRAPEVFNNLAAGLSGLPIWTAIVAAVNNGVGLFRGPSQLVTLTVGTSATAPPSQTVTLAGGTDGASGVTGTTLVGVDTTGSRTGMYALRRLGCSVGMLVECDASATWSLQAAFALSEGVYMIGTGPAGDTISNASTTLAGTGAAGYGFKMMFGDWCTFLDPVSGAQRQTSLQPFVAGWIAANGPQNSSLNKQLYGIVATQKSITNVPYQLDELALLESAGIDVVINPSPGGNYFSAAFGHNTAPTSSTWGDNYTRLTNFIAATVVAGMGGYIGQLQFPAAQAAAKAELDAFFLDLWTKGAIGSSVPNAVPWLVTLNNSNNPQSQVSTGRMLAQVKVIFASVIEIFEVDIEGGQTVQINRVSTTSAV